MSKANENKNDRLGTFISLCIHGLLLILFIFLLAWQPPDPPIEEYGITVNFGTSAAGSGQVQPKRKPVETKKVEKKVEDEPKPQEQPKEEVVDEQPQEVESTPEPVKEEVKEVKDVVKQPDPSPVVEEKPTPKKDPEPKKEKPKTDPKKNNKPPSNTSGNSNSSPSKSNQGDKPKKTGDQGDPKGSIDSKSLYGSQKGGNGSSYSLTGWKWDEVPSPDDNSNESGRIVFQITVDEEGEVIAVKTLQSTVTPAVRRKYEDAVYELTFSKTAQNSNAAASSVGTVTFIIKAN